jgi:multidrug efflux system outer membrane protein
MIPPRPIALALAALLSGCSLTPDYQRPAAPVPVQFPADAEGAPGTVALADIGWREFFPDERLQALIETALENNRNLRRAVLDIEQARALYDIRVSERLPEVGAASSAARTRTPGGLSPTGSPAVRTQYEVGVVVSAWELDFFGRLQSLSEAALAEFLATEEARRATQISLVAEVARSYLTERALAEQLALARQTLASRRESYQLVQQRYQAGAASRLELRQADVLVQTARVAVAALVRQHAQAVNALSLLVGKAVEELPAPQSLAQQNIITELPENLGSEVLLQRPDVLAAEQRLLAANANIGAARAAFFPRVSLTAGLGRASSDLSDLFTFGGGTTWSFIPQITLPIFDAGRVRRNLDLAEVRENLAVVEYEETIQEAFLDVANALVARDALEEQLSAQRLLLEAQAERLQLAEQRYEAGIASFLEVLDARRDLFDAEQTLVQTRQLRLSNSIDLYRALGGGLQAQTARPAAE